MKTSERVYNLLVFISFLGSEGTQSVSMTMWIFLLLDEECCGLQWCKNIVKSFYDCAHFLSPLWKDGMHMPYLINIFLLFHNILTGNSLVFKQHTITVVAMLILVSCVLMFLLKLDYLYRQSPYEWRILSTMFHTRLLVYGIINCVGYQYFHPSSFQSGSYKKRRLEHERKKCEGLDSSFFKDE